MGCGGSRAGPDPTTTRLLRHSSEPVELGCNFFDTAWAYGNGHSEQLLGRLVRNHPEQELHVATKVPPKNFKWPSRRGFTLDDASRPTTFDYAEKSLQNLGLPRIDLLQFHVWEDHWARRRALAACDRGLEAPGPDSRRSASASIAGSRPT